MIPRRAPCKVNLSPSSPPLLLPPPALLCLLLTTYSPSFPIPPPLLTPSHPSFPLSSIDLSLSLSLFPFLSIHLLLLPLPPLLSPSYHPPSSLFPSFLPPFCSQPIFSFLALASPSPPSPHSLKGERNLLLSDP